MEARAEAPRAAKAWTAPYSTAQSRPSTASRPGRRAGAIATREAPVVDERAYGMESGSVSYVASTMSTVLFALTASVSSSPPRYLIVWISSSGGCNFAPVDVMWESDLAAARALRASREPRVHACTAPNVVVEKVSTATCTCIGPLVRGEPW